MTTYYVDPLHGSSANNGLSSGTALGSFFDFFNGALPELGSAMGVTNGDLVYLMASTADNYPDGYFGSGGWTAGSGYNTFLTNPDYGSTGGMVRFIGVNPTTLEEDGTQYVIAGSNNRYRPRFYNVRPQGFVFRNCTIVGGWWIYSSGGGHAYINCQFADAYGGITKDAAGAPFYLDNCNFLFRNCRAFSTGASPYYTAFSQRDGSVYSTGGGYDSCEFYNFTATNGALNNLRMATVYNCRFKDCTTAVKFEYRSNRGAHQMFNCLIDNTSSHAIRQDAYHSTYVNHPKKVQFIGNMFNDIGGYIFDYTSTSATEVDIVVPADATNIGQREADGFLDWEGNVYQNVSSGVHSLPFNQELIDRGWHSVQGATAASFGLTHENGFGLAMVTGDNNAFNYFVGTSAGLGIFLKDFTEAVVSGSVPEFGESF